MNEMESMLQVISGKLEKTVQAVTSSVRHQELEKRHLTSRDQEAEKWLSGPRDPPSSGAFIETVKTLENLEEGDGDDNVEYAESVASECSMESNGSSNDIRLDEDCEDSDGESPSPEDNNMKRCPSGGSIVTYDEAASKLQQEGDCERTGDNRKGTKTSGGNQSNELEDDQDTSINAGQKMALAESQCTAWTDDKHYSYLNSIEQTFVQSLFGQHHTVDGGPDDQDCVESRPRYNTPYGPDLFTSLQRGVYDQREYYRPHFLHALIPSTSAIIVSPWIQHFNPRSTPQGHGVSWGSGGGQEMEGGIPPAGFEEGVYGSFGNGGVKEEVKEEVKESIPSAHNPETGVPMSWSSRFQSQHFASTSAHARADAGVQAKKRNCNLDPGCDAIYRPKKLKSTQRMLAAIDLELDQQFVLKQKKDLKRSELSYMNVDSEPLAGVIGGFDLNQELANEEENESLPVDSPKVDPEPVTKTTDFLSSFKEPDITGIKGKGCEVASDEKSDQAFPSRPLEGEFGEGSSGVNKKLADARGYYAQYLGSSLKARLDEANSNYQADSLDEEEEFEFLLKRSSKTYTWGGTVGPRRRVRNENVLLEAAALTGIYKDIEDHELPNKGNSE